MAIREILLLGNPVLRAKCEKVKSFSDAGLEDTARDLRDTLANFRRMHGFGRGIAAPQIGVSRKVIFISIDRPFELVNPEIVKRSKQMMTLWDDCFSFPDLLVKVKRHTRISVRYRDINGSRLRLDAEDGLSELLQHEIDHVNGILAVDRAIDSRHIVLRSEWEKLTRARGKGYRF
ncbi:MAG TPA: peptide deformylase [Bacteroidota bacterium]|jgi:peptide deformylase|nr:peptide deformylase [Bacteroidota bacterium]